MKELIEAFPENIKEAIQIAESSNLKQPKNEIKTIVMCGLGGSGIGAKMVANWLMDEINFPITLVNDYTLPAFVNENTLVIGSSYSGNTEETTMAIEEAHSKEAILFVFVVAGNWSRFVQKIIMIVLLFPEGTHQEAHWHILSFSSYIFLRV